MLEEKSKGNKKKDIKSITEPCGFLLILQLAIIVLKLYKAVSWSWLYVLSPIILLAILFLLVLIHVIYLNKKK